MPGLVIRGQEYVLDGLQITNFRDDSKVALKLSEDGRRRRTSWVRAICYHTTKGLSRGVVRPGRGPDVHAEQKVARYWSTSTKHAGAHLVFDSDGSVGCLADLAEVAAFHAGDVNDVSIGYELYQEADGDLYQIQLEAAAQVTDWLTAFFGIQRQLHFPYVGTVDRLRAGGRDVVGIYGHRDASDNRGLGDPRDEPLQWLVDRGYEVFRFDKREDLDAWKDRQANLNRERGCKLTVDGVAGPETVAELKKADYSYGLWTCGPA